MASVSDAAASGDRKALLIALREVISAAIDKGPADRDLATLSLRLSNISAELGDLNAVEGGGEVADAAGTPDEAFSTS